MVETTSEFVMTENAISELLTAFSDFILDEGFSEKPAGPQEPNYILAFGHTSQAPLTQLKT